jgi:hypothetical protein
MAAHTVSRVSIISQACDTDTLRDFFDPMFELEAPGVLAAFQVREGTDGELAQEVEEQ